MKDGARTVPEEPSECLHFKVAQYLVGSALDNQLQGLLRPRAALGNEASRKPGTGHRHPYVRYVSSLPSAEGAGRETGARCGPRTRPTRSHGLSRRSCIATAQSSTAWSRWRTCRAVDAFLCQIGMRTSSTSLLVTSETSRFLIRGNA